MLLGNESVSQRGGLRDDLADSACLGGGPGERCGGVRGEGSGEFVQFLRIAQGSLKELETHLLLASRVGLTTEKEVQPVLEKCEEIGKMLRALIRSIQKTGSEELSGTRRRDFPYPPLPTPQGIIST